MKKNDYFNKLHAQHSCTCTSCGSSCSGVTTKYTIMGVNIVPVGEKWCASCLEVRKNFAIPLISEKKRKENGGQLSLIIPA